MEFQVNDQQQMGNAPATEQPGSDVSNMGQSEQRHTLPTVKVEGAEELPIDLREAIVRKVLEIRKRTGQKRIFPIVVEGDDMDEKPYYIGYFKRPDLPTFSMFMNKVQQDSTQASIMLARNCFVEGDNEMLDGDLFVYGTLPKLSLLIQNRNASLVKVSSVGK